MTTHREPREAGDRIAEVALTVFEGKHHLVVVAGPRGKNRLPGVGFVSKDIDAVVNLPVPRHGASRKGLRLHELHA
jgi:hypothetical protein